MKLVIRLSAEQQLRLEGIRSELYKAKVEFETTHVYNTGNIFGYRVKIGADAEEVVLNVQGNLLTYDGSHLELYNSGMFLAIRQIIGVQEATLLTNILDEDELPWDKQPPTYKCKKASKKPLPAPFATYGLEQVAW